MQRVEKFSREYTGQSEAELSVICEIFDGLVRYLKLQVPYSRETDVAIGDLLKSAESFRNAVAPKLIQGSRIVAND